jgi:hypothetical protein
MSAPFRITRPNPGKGFLGDDDGLKAYLERLLKMIPGEIVGFYMIGSGFVPSEALVWSIIWAAVCLVLVCVVRIYGTSDEDSGQSAQTVPVGVAVIAFAIWIFWLGGPFEQMGIPHRKQFASLAVMLWSFVIPIVYKGPRDH